MRHGRRIAACVAVVLATLVGTAEARPHASELTLDERVEYQRRLEEVYWRNRIWPHENPAAKPPLPEVLPAPAIRAKVLDYLKKSRALDTLCSVR